VPATAVALGAIGQTGGSPALRQSRLASVPSEFRIFSVLGSVKLNVGTHTIGSRAEDTRRASVITG
jgi:hypothetical protein